MRKSTNIIQLTMAKEARGLSYLWRQQQEPGHVTCYFQRAKEKGCPITDESHVVIGVSAYGCSACDSNTATGDCRKTATSRRGYFDEKLLSLWLPATKKCCRYIQS